MPNMPKYLWIIQIWSPETLVSLENRLENLYASNAPSITLNTRVASLHFRSCRKPITCALEVDLKREA